MYLDRVSVYDQMMAYFYSTLAHIYSHSLPLTVSTTFRLERILESGLDRNCFFSPMGCVFIPKSARLRRLNSFERDMLLDKRHLLN